MYEQAKIIVIVPSKPASAALALAHRTGDGSHVPTLHFDTPLRIGEEAADLADAERARRIDQEWITKFTIPLLDQVIFQRGLFGRMPSAD